ncbi:molybdopterin synthase catalytic subunit [Neisseria sp. HSC-16F19]|nr:molybdenum cofactor biosynthesis protein MoaE [Neisseria sp. HSC-16F19]MCP2039791.1 molybdopterin synthase catalytic subunit [Neisseria sp. HSC-16F19]
MFNLTEEAINAALLRQSLLDNEHCGAFTCFEGWVRRHNEGNSVDYLVYSSYPELAKTQGEAVIAAAKKLFAIEDAVCVHRTGRLEVGDMAVWVGVTAGHRDAAFAACRFIIDTVKAEVPIWKQEFYRDGRQSAWLANPEGLPK